LRSLLGELIRLVVVDLNSMPDRFIEEKRIAGYYLMTDLRVALSDMPLFKILAGGTVMFTKAAGSIKPGQYVMYADENTPLYFALILYFLKDFNKAINEHNKIIEGTTDSNKLKAAWNNMGLCYEALENNKKAIQCYDRAIAYDPDLIQAQQNKKRLSQTKNISYSDESNKQGV
jgi:tetratricopeptide (TPR) repeat protein